MKKFFYLLSIILLLLSSLFPHLTFAESNTNSNEPKITEEEAADETVEAQEQDQMEELDEAELIEEELNEEKVLEDSSAEDKDVDNKSSGSNEPEKIEDEKDKDSESKERDSEEGIEVDDIEESEAEEEEKKLNTLMEQSITGEQSVSKLGHLKQNAEIFKELGKPNSKINSTNYTNAVYYIKKQATVNGEKYYLISTQPSSSKGIIGWVKSSQMDVHEHVGVDSKKKEMLVTGDGKAFSKAWGGNKDLVYNLSSYKGQTFTVNKTERVGNNIWYRGKLNGEQVFIHESYVNEVEEKETSKLGHLKSNTEIYKQLGNPNSKIDNSSYLNAVYYIKKEAEIGKEIYYLISTEASSTSGTIGWVKSSQMDVHEHVGVDSKKKEMLVTGDGKAFSKAWGGNKDLVYNLSSYKGQTFTVNKTERVGNNIWYRGQLGGKEVFIHESYVNEVEEKETSKLGHLKSNTEIYKQLGNPNSKIDNSSYLNAVYYIKKAAVIGKETYYLISTEASSTNGTIGWVKSSQINIHDHTGVDKETKVFTVKGEGQAYTKAWGGSKDRVYNLSNYKDQVFIVNKTERVGNNIWYRGKLNGEQVFIHESYVDEVEEKKTSKLGHLRSSTEIYKQLGDPDSKINNSNYLNSGYYIKKEAVIGKETYYLISTEASSTNGTIGWVKSSQINIHDHTGVDKETKVFTVKGEGQAYTKAWGGSKDRVYNLSNYKDQVFIVNKTERVGNNIWYRGKLNGEQVFIHESYVDEVEEKKTSKLGHLRSSTEIYKQLGDPDSKINNSNYLNSGYYIKKEAVIGKETYYLISTEASSTNGTIGWVKSSQINIHDHTGVDKETKVFTVKGEGQAYTKAWGGSKDRVYNLSNYKDQVFIVNKTERVGNNIWYRGKLNGEQVFIHESFVSEVKQTNTSKLGHLKSNAEIYKQLGDLNSKIDNTKYLNAVYYIKSQSTINGQEYYLISTQASSTDGTIGWVESSQINTHNHTGVDTESKTFFIDGKGQAYSKAWGGNKDFVYNLSNYKEQPFQINKTEKVGNNIWYRGVLNGRQVFIHESYLTEDRMVYENFNVTLNSALNTQMNQLQQTDKYRNSPAFIHQNYVNASNITTANVNVRAAANTSSHIYGILDRGSVVSILGSQNSFYQINYEAWRNPTRQDVLQYLNPSNNDIFQHLSLSDSVGVKASSINNLLMGKGILSGKGQAFIDGANQHQINEVYLISHALLETGNGGSALAQGVEVGTNGSGNPILVTSSNRSSLKNIQTVYNMFGIGAIDGDAHRAGAVHAYREGWNTPEKAITGGAKFIGDRYIHNSDNQDTLYKMRWNPANPGYHQYATDIGWAVKQVSTIKTMYEQLDNPVLRFKVPNYK